MQLHFRYADVQQPKGKQNENSAVTDMKLLFPTAEVQHPSID